MQYVVVDVDIDRAAIDLEPASTSRFIAKAALDASEAAFNLRRRNLLLPEQTVVFRLPVAVDWCDYENLAQDIVAALHNRCGRNPENKQLALYSQSFDYKLFDVPTNSIISDGGIVGEVLAKIRSDELLELVSNSDALFEHSRSILFGLPSGRLSDYFFRTGNLQIRQKFSTAMFFWSLPRLQGADHIIADTWSISTMAARFSDLLSSYSRTDKCAWSYLTEYLPTSKEAETHLRETLSALSEKDGGDHLPKLLFVCSFSSSGKLRDCVESVASRFKGRLQWEFIPLFASGGINDALCSIGPILDTYGLKGSDEGVVDTNVKVRDVNASSYFPDYRTPEAKKFLVSDAQDKEFFERYSGLDVFSVFKTGSSLRYFSNAGSDTKGRHHAYHISAAKLTASAQFKQRLKIKLDAFKGAHVDAILAVSDDASEAFVNSFLEVCSSRKGDRKSYLAQNWALDNPDPNLLELLKAGKGKTLWVLVPLSITGYSLQKLQVRLREIVGGPEKIRCDLNFVLGVLRPSNSEKIREVSEFFFKQESSETTGAMRIAVVESVLLPNWQEDECPWTQELRALSKALKEQVFPEEIDDLLRDRLRVLNRAVQTGLKDSDVFFVPFDDPRLIFNSGSRFIDRAKMFISPKTEPNSAKLAFGRLATPDVSEGDLACAVASAIQRWRDRVNRSAINPVSIDASTISNNNGFNESKLRAALWRSLTVKELKFGSRFGSDFVAMSERIFDANNYDPNYSKLEMEALLAFGRELMRSKSNTVADWPWRDTKYLVRHVRM